MNAIICETGTPASAVYRPSAGSPPHLSPHRPRILYADDDLTLQAVIQQLLTRSGYAVDTAEDGVTAWTALRNSHYDLLLTGDEMPDITGLELIRTLRQAGLNLPVILTANSFPLLWRGELERLKCQALLTKPFALHQLCVLIEKLMRSAASKQDAQWGPITRIGGVSQLAGKATGATWRNLPGVACEQATTQERV